MVSFSERTFATVDDKIKLTVRLDRIDNVSPRTSSEFAWRRAASTFHYRLTYWVHTSLIPFYDARELALSSQGHCTFWSEAHNVGCDYQALISGRRRLSIWVFSLQPSLRCSSLGPPTLRRKFGCRILDPDPDLVPGWFYRTPLIYPLAFNCGTKSNSLSLRGKLSTWTMSAHAPAYLPESVRSGLLRDCPGEGALLSCV